MSRNFELLSQLETDPHIGPALIANAAQAKERSPRDADSAISQELSSLARGIFFSSDGASPSAVVLAGIDSKSTSSSVCIELGRALLGQGAGSVCLIDGDVSSQRMTKLLLRNRRSVSRNTETDSCIEVEPNLWLAPRRFGDPARPNTLRPLPILKQTMVELRNSFTHLLIDSPGVNVSSDAAVLGGIADAALLIIEANVTRKASALRAKVILESMNVPILGTVLSNRTFPIPNLLYRRL
jgi:Mrp family chromosome partitioning ATPase